jgi:receptor protein-tyrosine kinase
MVTSALLGEGKTFCAINLAMSIAMEVDRSVLLVDADVMRPSVMDRIGLRNARGLLDVLADPQLDLGEVLLRTNVPKLSLLPTGTLHNRASEMLASTAMDKLLIELASRYSDRIVIFDSPPLLMSPGTASLATRMGQTVVVVEASKTPRRTVEQAFDAVADCPKVTALLNKCSSPMDGHVYGYYGQPVAPITPVSGVGPWLRSLFERRA